MNLMSTVSDLPLDAGGDVAVQRPMYEEFFQQTPLPDDVALTERALGGLPALEIATPRWTTTPSCSTSTAAYSRSVRPDRVRGSQAPWLAARRRG